MVFTPTRFWFGLREVDGSMEFTIGSGAGRLEFEGVELAAVSSRWNLAPRWTEVRIFAVADCVRLPSGRLLNAGFVVETVGRSVMPGEVDRHWAKVCDTPGDVALKLRDKSVGVRAGRRAGMPVAFRQALQRAWPDPDPELAELLRFAS